MANKIYVVDPTEKERILFLEFISRGKRPARKLKRAHTLLLADEGKTDSAIAETLHTDPSTVQRTWQRFVVGSLDWVLNEDSRPGARKGDRTS